MQTFTGDGVHYFQLCTLKSALKLQVRGIKIRAATSALARAKRYGFKARTAAECIPLVQAAIDKFIKDHPEQFRSSPPHVVS